MGRVLMKPMGFLLMRITSQIFHHVITIPKKSEGELTHIRDFFKTDGKQPDPNMKQNDSKRHPKFYLTEKDIHIVDHRVKSKP